MDCHSVPGDLAAVGMAAVSKRVDMPLPASGAGQTAGATTPPNPVASPASAPPASAPRPLGNTPDLQSIIDDPVRRAEAEAEALRVARVTAILYTVARLAPHPAVRIPAVFLAGLHEGARGKLKPGVQTAGNLAPQPFGYVKPEVVGLKPNYYLPNGITKYLPLEADLLGQGIPQQRAEDASAEAVAYRARLRATIEGERDDVLAQIASGDYPTLSRAAVVVATSEGVGFQDLRNASRAELSRRERLRAEALAATAPPVVASAPGQLGTDAIVQQAAQSGSPVDVPPVNAQAIDSAGNRDRNQQAAHIELRDP